MSHSHARRVVYQRSLGHDRGHDLALALTLALAHALLHLLFFRLPRSSPSRRLHPVPDPVRTTGQTQGQREHLSSAPSDPCLPSFSSFLSFQGRSVEKLARWERRGISGLVCAGRLSIRDE